MGIRVGTSMPEQLTRRLLKNFNGSTKAVGTAAPTLRTQAMGRAGKTGAFSFVFLDGGAANATIIWEWNSQLANVNSGNGWMKSGPNSTINSLSVDQLSRATATVPEDALFFIQATTPVTECFVSGAQDDGNPNTDTTQGTNH